MEVEFDQHFLINPQILEKTIKNAQINKNDKIIEIGPGKGILTKEILKKNPQKLITLEIDEKFAQNLEEIKSQNSNFEFIFGNALETIKNLEFDKIIANIPYAITEPLYKKILKLKTPMIILLHGLTFYKISSDEKNKWNKYINSTYKIELIETVLGDNFEPKTKTKSALVKLTLKTNLTKEEEFYQNIIEKENRRTKNALIFSLIDTLKITKKEATKIINELEINEQTLNKKFENLSNSEFQELNKKLTHFFS